tara:strand:+ start:112 stop:570 length:459 start_codon:yes stop_codon:yes gene_type:complete
MSSLADTYITYRIIKILVTSWKDQEAYKLGIIDDKGNVLKKSKDLKSGKEKDAYTILIRFVFNLKRILNQVPGGKSKFGSYGAAAILLLREEDGKEQLIERPILPANRLIPSSAPVLKKLINGGYAQKIKGFSSEERQKFTIALSNLLDTLE